jgi:hypothetical protein
MNQPTVKFVGARGMEKLNIIAAKPLAVPLWPDIRCEIRVRRRNFPFPNRV